MAKRLAYIHKYYVVVKYDIKFMLQWSLLITHNPQRKYLQLIRHYPVMSRKFFFVDHMCRFNSMFL